MLTEMIKEADVDLTLAAFMHKEGEEVCMHMLCTRTGLPRDTLRFVVVELQKQKKIERARAKVAGDVVYRLKKTVGRPSSGKDSIQVQEGMNIQRLIGGLDETTARNRVSMLKRMKSRLINEWHPVIDILLRDYESGLTKLDEELDPKGAEDGEFRHIWEN